MTDRSAYNEDIAWLVNDMPAALGEKGANVDPSGGGGRTLSDNWGFLERAHSAMGDVGRARRLMAVWSKLTPRQQNVLSAYYTLRQVVVTRGATAAFGQYARVALLLAGKGRDGLVRALSDQNNAKHVPAVTEARRSAHAAVEQAHAAWDAARVGRADAWAEGST